MILRFQLSLLVIALLLCYHARSHPLHRDDQLPSRSAEAAHDGETSPTPTGMHRSTEWGGETSAVAQLAARDNERMAASETVASPTVLAAALYFPEFGVGRWLGPVPHPWMSRGVTVEDMWGGRGCSSPDLRGGAKAAVFHGQERWVASPWLNVTHGASVEFTLGQGRVGSTFCPPPGEGEDVVLAIREEGSDAWTVLGEYNATGAVTVMLDPATLPQLATGLVQLRWAQPQHSGMAQSIWVLAETRVVPLDAPAEPTEANACHSRLEGGVLHFGSNSPDGGATYVDNARCEWPLPDSSVHGHDACVIIEVDSYYPLSIHGDALRVYEDDADEYGTALIQTGLVAVPTHPGAHVVFESNSMGVERGFQARAYMGGADVCVNASQPAPVVPNACYVNYVSSEYIEFGSNPAGTQYVDETDCLFHLRSSDWRGGQCTEVVLDNFDLTNDGDYVRFAGLYAPSDVRIMTGAHEPFSMILFNSHNAELNFYSTGTKSASGVRGHMRIIEDCVAYLATQPNATYTQPPSAPEPAYHIAGAASFAVTPGFATAPRSPWTGSGVKVEPPTTSPHMCDMSTSQGGAVFFRYGQRWLRSEPMQLPHGATLRFSLTKGGTLPGVDHLCDGGEDESAGMQLYISNSPSTASHSVMWWSASDPAIVWELEPRYLAEMTEGDVYLWWKQRNTWENKDMWVVSDVRVTPWDAPSEPSADNACHSHWDGNVLHFGSNAPGGATYVNDANCTWSIALGADECVVVEVDDGAEFADANDGLYIEGERFMWPQGPYVGHAPSVHAQFVSDGQGIRRGFQATATRMPCHDVPGGLPGPEEVCFAEGDLTGNGRMTFGSTAVYARGESCAWHLPATTQPGAYNQLVVEELDLWARGYVMVSGADWSFRLNDIDTSEPMQWHGDLHIALVATYASTNGNRNVRMVWEAVANTTVPSNAIDDNNSTEDEEERASGASSLSSERRVALGVGVAVAAAVMGVYLWRNRRRPIKTRASEGVQAERPPAGVAVV